MIISNDGREYSEEEWWAAEELLARSLNVHQSELSRWLITGAISTRDCIGTFLGMEYYMRDLVRGIVRDDHDAYAEYMASVNSAGVV